MVAIGVFVERKLDNTLQEFHWRCLVHVGTITLPAQLKTHSDSADVGGIAKSFLVRGARLGKWTP